MPYVQRNENGLVVGQYAIAQEGYAEEWLEPDSIELQPTLQEVISAKIQEMDNAIRTRLNAQAVSMNFESIATGILAASLPIGEYRQDDGAKLHLWAARTWQKAEQIRNEFLSGQRPEPTWDEVESELPPYPIE